MSVSIEDFIVNIELADTLFDNGSKIFIEPDFEIARIGTLVVHTNVSVITGILGDNILRIWLAVFITRIASIKTSQRNCHGAILIP